MPVIIPCIQEPTDTVIQGERSVPPINISYIAPISTIQLIQGEQVFSNMPIKGIPEAMIGQTDWYGIKPRLIGPIAYGQAGLIDMISIGNPNFISPNIDPIQTWLNSPFPIDSTGMWFDLTPDMLGAPEATIATVFPPQEPSNSPVTMIPRSAVYRSGLVKRITSVSLPSTVGQHMMEYFAETTQRYFLTGITKNHSGDPLGYCTVYLLRTSKINVNPDVYSNPVEAVTISDSNGNFSFQVEFDSYQLLAYLPGDEDVAGVTSNELVPILG